MKPNKTEMLVVVAALLASSFTGWCGDPKAEAIADAVIQASGGANWPKVKRIQFTFNVEDKGKQVLSAQHKWDLVANTDEVTWNGKTVTVKTDAPALDGDGKAAFQRWTNDTYWLLAPLKLRDRGTSVSMVTPPPEGFDVIQLAFDSVGLTPKDVYHFYVDRETHLVRRWVYIPSPEKKISGTWEDYKETGGLKLATAHQFGEKRITISDLKVETE